MQMDCDVVICGDAIEVLRVMESESVHCVITSPPYWNLRDYGVAGQIGLEPTFAGSGTVGKAARDLGRHFIMIELNPEYCDMARRRIGDMFCEPEIVKTSLPNNILSKEIDE